MWETVRRARAVERCVDLWTLGRIAHGTAMVSKVVVATGHTMLMLSYPVGEVRVRVEEAPVLSDYDLPPGVRPLAVRVTHGLFELSCRLLVTSGHGAEWVEISTAQALAYADAGIHTVFRALGPGHTRHG